MAAHAILVRHTLRVEHFSNFVRLMAINAGRQLVCFLFPQLPFDHFAVDDLNLGVTFRTGCGNIPAGN